MKQFYILSFDGGGMRGIFAAKLLSLIHDHYHLPNFQLCIGTSTGSILASAYANDINFNTMLNLYKQAGHLIFTKRFFFGPRLLEKAIKSQYDSYRLKAVLRQVFDHTLLHNLKKNLIIPATNLESSSQFLFKSYDCEPNIYLYEAILASCCAPTYFDPININSKLLADGGMYANNPSLIALAEALHSFKVKFSDIKILSIGSGHFLNCYDKNTTKWGLVNGWKIRTLVEFSSSLQSQTTYETIQKILNPEQILRLNFENEEIIAPDDFKASALLEQKALECFTLNCDKILKFIND